MSEPREWTNIDKSDWGDGPWQAEPGKIHWVDPATDLDCLMVRQDHHGAWCGYVGVTEGHPWFGKEVWGDDGVYADVHGGLSYAAACRESADPGVEVCHVPFKGRPDHVWWFGFDCHHVRDLAPAYEARGRRIGFGFTTDEGAVYRDRAYVEAEVASLARQLREAA